MKFWQLDDDGIWFLRDEQGPIFAISNLTIKYVNVSFEVFSGLIKEQCGESLPREVWDYARKESK